MHGLGNDFAIIDARETVVELKSDFIRVLSNRNFGIGFDQLAVIYKTDNSSVAAHLKFWNSDGSPSATCGNATRCIARMLMEELKTDSINLSTDFTILESRRDNFGNIAVNMGIPLFGWSDIPLAYECDTSDLPIEGNPIATNIGNPHCTFLVENIDDYSISQFGQKYENHELFPERTNVQLAQILNNSEIRVKVWERGAGITMSSGSSSCAVTVAASRRGLIGKKSRIILDGGELEVVWGKDGVWMSGETAHVYDGTISNELFSNWKNYEKT